MSDSERSLFMPKTKTPGLCSVVCTTYNHAAYSAIALQSIFDQVYRNIEIVVIDDGSTDGNVDALKGKLVACPFPHQLITQSNSGKVGLNFNRALDAATGEYVCLLSLDDVLLPDCISAKMPILLADKHMTFVANTSNIEIGSDGAVINEMFVHPVHGKNCNTASQLLEHEYEHIGSFYVQGIVFRTDIIEAVGGFDPNMIGDDLILRTRIFRHMVRHPDLTFALLPSPGFLYRKHDQNLHRNNKTERPRADVTEVVGIKTAAKPGKKT